MAVKLTYHVTGLEPTLKGLGGLERKNLARMVSVTLNEWYSEDFKPALRAELDSGRGMRPLKYRYRRWKRSMVRSGTMHRNRDRVRMAKHTGTLKFTGYMRMRVLQARPTVRPTEMGVRMYIRFKKPSYLVYVHQGTRHARARPFITYTKNLTISRVITRLRQKFGKIKLTASPTQFTA